jgi:hypothetical protein
VLIRNAAKTFIVHATGTSKGAAASECFTFMRDNLDNLKKAITGKEQAETDIEAIVSGAKGRIACDEAFSNGEEKEYTPTSWADAVKHDVPKLLSDFSTDAFLDLAGVSGDLLFHR